MLPMIDLCGLSAGDPAALRRVAAELGRACRDTGFFYIRNHGVPDALMSGIFASSRAFFRDTEGRQGGVCDCAVATQSRLCGHRNRDP